MSVLVPDTTPTPRRRHVPTTLAIALVMTIAGAVGVSIAAQRAVDHVPRVAGVDRVLSPSSDSIDNYLLVGSDSRDQGDPLTGEVASASGHRSDTIMLLRYDRSKGTASLLSIPRDLYVTIPGHPKKSRINAAFNDGPDVLVRTIQQELQIPVHHYVEIDFTGFERLVTALGGVTVCFDVPVRDFNTGLSVEQPGCHRLNGQQGLAYARSRHYEELRDGKWREDPTSDFGRARRQRDFVNRCLQAAVAQVKSNPYRAGELVAAVSSAMKLDAHLDPIDAASSLKDAVSSGLVSYALPVTPKKIDGNDVLILGAGADVVLKYFRGQGPPPPAAA
jgi:LCP family protein required for cell wall assembly